MSTEHVVGGEANAFRLRLCLCCRLRLRLLSCLSDGGEGGLILLRLHLQLGDGDHLSDLGEELERSRWRILLTGGRHLSRVDIDAKGSLTVTHGLRR